MAKIYIVIMKLETGMPGDSREFFRRKFAKDDDNSDDMYAKIMSRIDDLILTDISFFESIDYSKKKDK